MQAGEEVVGKSCWFFWNWGNGSEGIFLVKLGGGLLQRLNLFRTPKVVEASLGCSNLKAMLCSRVDTFRLCVPGAGEKT